MKCFHFFALFVLLFAFLSSSCDDPLEDQSVDFCGYMNDFEERIQSDPIFVENLERIERLTQEYIDRIAQGGNSNFRTTLVTIPVVVHVVYKNATENVSNAQIQSQIDALNNVFRLANTDVSTVPPNFLPLAADVLIEFELAKRDANCNSTTGITRTQTTVPSFGYSSTAATAQGRNPIKYTSSGGRDGWPSDEYLNLWVGDLAGGLLGYAAFPADLASRPTEDGVVMDYTAFGTSGTVSSPFDLGRVAAHEVGHWLNLRHIWGDDCPSADPCGGTDFVSDTPNQQCNNSGCPPFPRLDACAPSSPGVMYMNHMDYTTDACRRMFTIGQSDRMSATLYKVRNSLLGSQGGIAPPAAISQDLWMKDTDEDIGNEPNGESTILYLSDDIWVRNNNDGLVNQESQNPLGGANNYVYVRVRNRGCNASSGGNLKLYWAKASSGLAWPQPWNGTVNAPFPPFPVMGGSVGTQVITPINGGDYQIFEFPWNGVPLPSDYAGFGADKAHFCLLARVETSSTAPYGMAFPETATLWQNVVNNNNIVWKNVSIDETSNGGFASVIVTNYSEKPIRTTLEFNFLENDEANIGVDGPAALELGEYEVEFSEELYELIQQGGLENIDGLQYIDGRKYRIVSPIAQIRDIPLATNELHVLNVELSPTDETRLNRWLVNLNVFQKESESDEIYGGQCFKFIKQ